MSELGLGFMDIRRIYLRSTVVKNTDSGLGCMLEQCGLCGPFDFSPRHGMLIVVSWMPIVIARLI